MFNDKKKPMKIRIIELLNYNKKKYGTGYSVVEIAHLIGEDSEEDDASPEVLDEILKILRLDDRFHYDKKDGKYIGWKIWK